jgi:hypothetical protein
MQKLMHAASSLLGKVQVLPAEPNALVQLR